MIFKTMRFLGALALFGMGAVHLQQYIGADYSQVPTIGPLFLLNAIGAGIVGVALLVPFERVLAGRKADMAVSLVTGGAVAMAVGALVSLFISEYGLFFGFSENGYSLPVVLAIISEAAAVVLLAPVAVVSLGRALQGRGRRFVPAAANGAGGAR